MLNINPPNRPSNFERLSATELEALRNHHYDYINLLQRLSQPYALIRFNGAFVVESGGFLIPYLEAPFNTTEFVDRLLNVLSPTYPLDFAGIPMSHYQLITACSEVEILWEEPCHLYVYEGAPFDLTELSLPEGFTCEPLKLSDAPLIFHHYTYPDDGITTIENIIKKRPTLSIRYMDQPVSWLVRREDGSMGIMYTINTHRGKGFGHILSKQMVNAILATGEIPYLHIKHGNQPSINLAESLGFSKVIDVMWFGVRKTSSTDSSLNQDL
ncbi:MAG: GNAT family N-acetyltransferase [Firmicutes bacterium]|nr:GNAT family N-acetyltransferase [Bacillota bacterium]